MKGAAFVGKLEEDSMCWYSHIMIKEETHVCRNVMGMIVERWQGMGWPKKL